MVDLSPGDVTSNLKCPQVVEIDISPLSTIELMSKLTTLDGAFRQEMCIELL
jgi:hypothetical protein